MAKTRYGVSALGFFLVSMTQVEQQMLALAQRLHLDEKAANRLPDSISAIASQLKATPDEVIKLTAFAPPLLTLIANTCRQHD